MDLSMTVITRYGASMVGVNVPFEGKLVPGFNTTVVWECGHHLISMLFRLLIPSVILLVVPAVHKSTTEPLTADLTSEL